MWFVRHGESGWNARGLIQGQSPAAPGLSPAGRLQVAAAAASLLGCGAGAVLTSDLARAFESAVIVAERLGVPLRVERRLAERALGAAEGAPSSCYPVRELGVCDGTVVDPDAAPPGGETVRQLVRRVEGLLAELDARACEPLVLVTHGGVVRAAQAILEGDALEQMPWREVGNAAVIPADLRRLRARRATTQPSPSPAPACRHRSLR